MIFTAVARKAHLLGMLCGIVLLSACAQTGSDSGNWQSGPKGVVSGGAMNPQLQAMALREASSKRSKGQRVWCVPFARTASGVNIQGNAKTWWGQAAGVYARGNQPKVGAVMTFQSTGKLPLGHVAVVSQVVSPRKILIDHANWKRNQISLGMAVIDVSSDNSWSDVRVESAPNTFGRNYPVKGFIYP